MMSRLRSSLRYKIGLWMLFLSLVPLLLAGALAIAIFLFQLQNLSARLNDAEVALRSDVVGRTLRGAAADTVADLDSYLLERIVDLRRWGEEAALVEAARQGSQAAQGNGLSALAGDPAAIQEKLQGALFIPIAEEAFSPALSYVFVQVERPGTPFVEILLTEAHGINVLATRPVGQVSHAAQPWWQAASRPDRAGIGLTEVVLDPETHQAVIGLALPVVDPDTKQVLGVLRALVSLDDLQRRVSQKAVSYDADVRVFTGSGLLIADTASNHSPQVILNPDESLMARAYQPATQAMSARPGLEGASFMLVEGKAGTEIAGFAHSSGSEYYDRRAQLSGFAGFGWGVAVVQPEQRALGVLAPLIETGRAFSRVPVVLSLSLLAVMVAAAVLGLVGAILISGQVSVPLVELSRIAQQVQQGDLSARVEVRSQDEVGILGQAFNQMTDGLRRRERERDIFGRVVSPEVRERLLSGELELGGETRWVAVLFADIRDFSAISEKMPPQQVVAFLNEYLTEMADAIRPWEGYINNFIGDAIVAIFGAPLDQPDKEWKAVSAALAMRQRLEALNQRRMARGEAPIHSGIGISSGEVVAGQIGSLERLLYTVIGDAVNVAARLEALTKEYPYAVLINGATARAVAGRPGVALKSLGLTVIRGRLEPVDLYAVETAGENSSSTVISEL